MNDFLKRHMAQVADAVDETLARHGVPVYNQQELKRLRGQVSRLEKLVREAYLEGWDESSNYNHEIVKGWPAPRDWAESKARRLLEEIRGEG